MSQIRTDNNTGFSLVGQKFSDYSQLVKLRLNLTVVFSSVMAYLIACGGTVDLILLLVLSLGGFLVTGASNALNQVLEKEYDRDMKRTENRPMAAGRMTISEGVLAAGFMSVVGIGLLATIYGNYPTFGRLDGWLLKIMTKQVLNFWKRKMSNLVNKPLSMLYFYYPFPGCLICWK